jgi:hypothetical protein
MNESAISSVYKRKVDWAATVPGKHMKGEGVFLD